MSPEENRKVREQLNDIAARIDARIEALERQEAAAAGRHLPSIAPVAAAPVAEPVPPANDAAPPAIEPTPPAIEPAPAMPAVETDPTLAALEQALNTPTAEPDSAVANDPIPPSLVSEPAPEQPTTEPEPAPPAADPPHAALPPEPPHPAAPDVVVGMATPVTQAEAPRPLVVASSAPARTGIITYIALLIAVLALAASLYQGYLFKGALDTAQRNLDALERNGARAAFVSACRTAGETYVEIKPRVSALMPAADRGNVAGASRVTETHRLEAQAAIAKFSGLAPYLAGAQDAAARARYIELTRQLTAILEASRTTPLADIDKLFEPADKVFAAVSEDCARLIRAPRN